MPFIQHITEKNGLYIHLVGTAILTIEFEMSHVASIWIQNFMSLGLVPLYKIRAIYIHTLRRIFGPRRDEVMGKWRRLHNEELNDLYSSPNIVLVII